MIHDPLVRLVEIPFGLTRRQIDGEPSDADGLFGPVAFLIEIRHPVTSPQPEELGAAAALDLAFRRQFGVWHSGSVDESASDGSPQLDPLPLPRRWANAPAPHPTAVFRAACP